jgi:hypothetical protein
MIALDTTRGVELILSNALSICIPSSQIRSLGFKSNSLFSAYLEMGADFPDLKKFTIQPTRNFLPVWADSWPDGKKPSTRSSSKKDRPEDDDTDESDEDGGSQPPPPAPPVPLPLPPFLPPGFPPHGSGGRTL